MRRAILILVMCATAVAAWATPAASDPGARPFAAWTTGVAAFVPFDPAVCPVGLRTESSATGYARHLGAIEMRSWHCTPPGADITGGTMTFVAANGDEVHLEYEGTAALDPSTAKIGDVFPVFVDFEIVGGTGRFDDATGGGTSVAWVVFEGLGDPEWAATWFFVGTIGY
jgi:hypothetical protein